MVKYYLTANKDLMYDTESERIVANEGLDECILDIRVCAGVESLVHDYIRFKTYSNKVFNEWLPYFRFLEENLVENIGYGYDEADALGVRDLLNLREEIARVEALGCYLNNKIWVTSGELKDIVKENLKSI